MSTRGGQGDVGLALAMLRMLRGWERADLVRALGVSRSWISEIETGKKEPATRTVQRITGALGLPMSAVEEALALVRSVRGLAAAGTAGVTGGGSGGRQAQRGGDSRAQPDVGLAWDGTGLSGVLFELAGARLRADRGDQPDGEVGGSAGAVGGGGPGVGSGGAEDPDGARRRGAELWTRLRRYARAERRALVREAVEFQDWALCERLCEESARAGAERPAAAVELAELAVEVASLAPVDQAWAANPARLVEAGRPGELPAHPVPATRNPATAVADADRWRDRLSAYAWGFVGAARRLAGDSVGAEEALARSRELWPDEAPGER